MGIKADIIALRAKRRHLILGIGANTVAAGARALATDDLRTYALKVDQLDELMHVIAEIERKITAAESQ